MKKTGLYILLSFLMIAPAFAGGTAITGMNQQAGEKEYKMRVDGMACPYCAYGIEKKLKKIDGVKAIDVDLKKGIVSVCALGDVEFTDDQLTQLFKDSGFTYRSMETAEQCQAL